MTNTGSQSQSRPGVPRLDHGHGQITKTYAVHQQAIRILLSYPQTCRWMTAIDRDDRQRGSRPVQAYCTGPHRTMTKCINNDEDRHIFLALGTVTKMTWSHAAAYGKKTFQTVSENIISDNEMFTALVDTSKLWDCPGNLCHAPRAVVPAQRVRAWTMALANTIHNSITTTTLHKPRPPDIPNPGQVMSRPQASGPLWTWSPA